MQLVHRYHNLLLGEELLESALHSEFSEYLNAEIVLRTIVNVVSALAWLKSTYLYIRVRGMLISQKLSRHMIPVSSVSCEHVENIITLCPGVMCLAQSFAK